MGAIVVYFVDKRSYNEGLVDAVVMHNSGKLTYYFFKDEEGVDMIEINVSKEETKGGK